MARQPQLLDRWGNPIERKVLTTEVAAATLGGVRSPLPGYPADGLNPLRLAQILREADAGDPLRYLELAEVIEERDLHYLGVLSTRKRSVAQIEISVEAGSDDPLDQSIAEMVRDWLARDELADELFDILDAIGKGYSFTEILWDTSEGQWMPRWLEWRDPRWFRPARKDLTTPLLIDDNGQEVPLPGGKFIHAVIRGKSGLPVRSGLARVASWAWMFKAFTQRDWSIFAQTYGQPLRLGKWAPGASEADKDTLFRAVANIAGDCAAIIPESMSIEFVETGSVGSSVDLYERRADWLDRQISKAVLGQTTTTDAVSGGHAVAQEHRQVQEDIERADARALAGILNRDLVRPWVQLEYGPREHYPRIVIARPEAEDLDRLARSLGVLVPLGLKLRFGTDEVVTTLLLNFVVLMFVSMMIEGPMKDPLAFGWPQSVPVPDNTLLGKLVARTRLHAGLMIALALAVAVWWVQARTVFGMRSRAAGLNARAAAFAGVPLGRTLAMVACLSGGLAGLAGAIEVMGVKGYVTTDLSPNYGYSGIVIAMLANLNPIGVIGAALFSAVMFVGADSMSRALGVPSYIADVTVALSLLTMLIALFFTQYRIRR